MRTTAEIASIGVICRMVRRDADDRRTSAGYNGAQHDGGAQELERQIEWFKAGAAWAQGGDMPAAWKSYAEQATKEADPEFVEYQRMKRKFGDT